MPPFVILAFLANLVVWRIFEPNRANPRVKHSVSIHIGPGWGQNCKKITKSKNFKIGPKKSAIRPFFGSKTPKMGTWTFFFGFLGPNCHQSTGWTQKNWNLKPFSSKCVHFPWTHPIAFGLSAVNPINQEDKYNHTFSWFLHCYWQKKYGYLFL